MEGHSAHQARHRGDVLAERAASLPADPLSPREARRIFREEIRSAGGDTNDWVDRGELAISEIVTNALLHAHTAIDFSLTIYADGVCIEVRDQNPTLPVARAYDDDASTGRGMGLVAEICTEFGIESLGADGKVVWFCIGDDTSSDRSAGELLEAWTVDDGGDADASDAHDVVVMLRDMPATLWLSARQHHDALLRELALYAAEHPVDVDFAAVDQARNFVSVPLARAVDRAHAAGQTRAPLPEGHPSPLPWVPEGLDLELAIDRRDGPKFLALPDALDLAERLATDGTLLVRPGLPEITAVRDWACEQVVAQLAGTPPAPWGGVADEGFETASSTTAITDETWDIDSVRDSHGNVVAADDANRIIAISAPLAAILGWDRAALIGRRVVTLIPPRLREAHVAGFTRHLTTGEAHVLGVDLELPVLRYDRTELRCHFLIERAATSSTRAVYIAAIDPIGDQGPS